MQGSGREPMLDLYLFEASQLMEQLEDILLTSEKSGSLSPEQVNEIFRIMHTVKGSSAMMMFNNVASMAHSVEDLFYFIREKKPKRLHYSEITDIVLAASDFIKGEVGKIEAGELPDGNESAQAERIRNVLEKMKSREGAGPVAESPVEEGPAHFYISSYATPQETTENLYVARVFFEEGCQMENIRAYTILHSLKDICSDIHSTPEDVIEDPSASERIVRDGFLMGLSSREEIGPFRRVLEEALFVSRYELEQVESLLELFPSEQRDNRIVLPDTIREDFVHAEIPEQTVEQDATAGLRSENRLAAGDITQGRGIKQNLISVNVQKLDKLMDLVGEIVITESMVTMNPDLAGLQLDSFSKAARQLRKLTDELQDVVMSVRMIPIAGTFNKMNRIVRDMGKKLGKEAELVLLGEETEVDKNIIDNLGDPLMHLIRNAMDHGIESAETRRAAGKPETGRLVLEARNSGGDVEIRIIDDGKGLNREEILKKARENGLVERPDADISDKEAFSFILLPGFSTKELVTEFSGRGVGMDVVKKNIEKLGGTIGIDSRPGVGTTMGIRIPLTLAIVNGMEIKVGNSLYTIPIMSIRESFRMEPANLVRDVHGNEMLMIRGECMPVIRLHEAFGVRNAVEDLREGIMVMVEGNGRMACLFADSLIGEQQVVVKPLPTYILKFPTRHVGIGGCTILGDGSISLIIDIPKVIGRFL